MKLYYFAYGSNMCTGRLRARVPSARPVFVTQLRCHTLKFQKRSQKDGSAKADAEHTGRESDVVWGVVFEIDAAQKQHLDEAEGCKRPGWAVLTENYVNEADSRGVVAAPAEAMLQGSSSSMRLMGWSAMR
ncbi:MAG TPA: gamma-glutamylcyclotransferase family protein, partial [Terriglobales bacterium]|nr:gamma-glutamylcyclotransferase family protein [Terriglobales bacterium]